MLDAPEGPRRVNDEARNLLASAARLESLAADLVLRASRPECAAPDDLLRFAQINREEAQAQRERAFDARKHGT